MNEFDTAWAAEAEKRIDAYEYECGEIQAVDLAEMLSRYGMEINGDE